MGPSACQKGREVIVPCSFWRTFSFEGSTTLCCLCASFCSSSQIRFNSYIPLFSRHLSKNGKLSQNSWHFWLRRLLCLNNMVPNEEKRCPFAKVGRPSFFLIISPFKDFQILFHAPRKLISKHKSYTKTS